MMAQMKVHGISDKVMGLSSPRTMFFISLEPVKVFCQIWQTRFFKVQKDAAFQGLIRTSVQSKAFEYLTELKTLSRRQKISKRLGEINRYW